MSERKEDDRLSDLWAGIEAEEAEARELFAYRPKFAGPCISKIYSSDRLVGNAALALGERACRAWDLLCEADPTLETWLLASLEVQRGDVFWKIADRDGRATTRRTKTGSLTVYIPVGDLVDTDDLRVLQRYMLWTLTLRAEMDSLDPPPDTTGLLTTGTAG